ncbi:response regulator [Pedobacter frigidisoli]|uniref:Response regulator n=1 Tax=Pedobacter frigidisoli TaxID=2530455 RepID=A0A4R0P5S3_9SPHI|nr:response regulator [Pedobacter frigidisoli]TCD11186.1 response regulator [Pedobacter frigidisoli]
MKRILFIVDEQSLQEIVQLVFKENYIVKGIISSRNLEEVISNFNPDIILLDVDFGGADGRVVCRYLKGYQPTAHIPIVLITANTVTDSDYRCEPNSIVEKPFDIEVLKSIVAEMIN